MLSKRATVARPTPGATTYTVVASTEGLDRDRDTIRASGWRLENFMLNPVILLGHDHKAPPVARAVDVKVKEGQLVLEIEFPPQGVYPAADMARTLVAQGFLRGASVGFNGLRSKPNDDGGTDYLEQELLEVSLVGIPSNPLALLEAKARGVAQPAVFKAWLGGSRVGLDADEIEAFAEVLPQRPRLDLTEVEVRALIGGRDDVEELLHAQFGIGKSDLRGMISRATSEAIAQARARYDLRLRD